MRPKGKYRESLTRKERKARFEVDYERGGDEGTREREKEGN